MENYKRLDPFVVKLERGNWNYDEIVDDICELGNTNQLGWDGLPIHFKRPDMTVQAQIWMAFVLRNVNSVSDTSSPTLKIAQLIWYIIKGKQVNTVNVISNKICDIVYS